MPQVIPNFRVRAIPVLGTMPAMMGLAAASYILCQLAEQPFAAEPVFRIAVRLPTLEMHAGCMECRAACVQ